VGWDIARRRDLSIIWVLEKVGDVLWTREVVRMRRETFANQLNQFHRVMQAYGVRRACLDQTGMGEPIVEQVQRKYGSYTTEGILFTNPVKQDLAVVLKKNLKIAWCVFPLTGTSGTVCTQSRKSPRSLAIPDLMLMPMRQDMLMNSGHWHWRSMLQASLM
jgi:phage FluMu gp28-like protein